jgi:hypothetical protein
MTTPSYARPPHVAATRSGVWLSSCGLLTDADVTRLIGWLSRGVAKHRKLRTSPVPAVTVVDNGVHVDGLGRLDHAAALALAHRPADCLTPGVIDATLLGDG